MDTQQMPAPDQPMRTVVVGDKLFLQTDPNTDMPTWFRVQAGCEDLACFIAEHVARQGDRVTINCEYEVTLLGRTSAGEER